MKSLMLFMFAMAAGFTASGIVACLYRIAGFDGGKGTAQIVRAFVMIVAGPTVLFETAMRGYRDKKWSPVFFWCVSAGLAYWSMAIGLFVIDIALKL